MFLRATVTYSDKFGSGKTASAVSARRVEARTLSNAAPSFADQDSSKATPYIDIALSVRENTAVGRPIGRRVSATDADADILFYELLDTPDLEDDGGDARFTIDSASGQIRIGRMLGADDREREDEDSTALTGDPALPDDEDADEAHNGEYVLRVRASDPSTASATVNVIVRVTQVNEPPDFAEDVPVVLNVRENEDPPVITVGDSGTPVDADTYAVTDQDRGDTTFTYSVSGDDSEFFEFDTCNKLKLQGGPRARLRNERFPIRYQSITRYGPGSRGQSTTLDVTIEVVDTEDPGEGVPVPEASTGGYRQ